MSHFENLEEILNCKIYFCDPGKPGQRGLNEKYKWFTKTIL